RPRKLNTFPARADNRRDATPPWRRALIHPRTAARRPRGAAIALRVPHIGSWMFTIIGIIVVIGSVIGGFTMAGGKVLALCHVSEIVVIGGTALATMLTPTRASPLGSLGGRIAVLMQPPPFTKNLYLEALKLLYELFQLARKDGLVAIESHIEAP